jgi:hypothetical protein
MAITFKLQLYCKTCDRGIFINITANSKKDVKHMSTKCVKCNSMIPVNMFLFDDLKINEMLEYESLKNKFLTNQLTEDEFWNIIEN